MINDPALRLDLIGAKALFREQTVHHQVAEGARVAAGFPDFRVHDDRGVQANNVIAQLRHRAPPRFLDIPFELRAQGAVIPKPIQTAVDFGGLKNEPAALAQGDNLLHQLAGFWLGHKSGSFLEGYASVKGTSNPSRINRGGSLAPYSMGRSSYPALLV